VKHIEFYSDVGDPQIPTVTFDQISNAEQGHCAKTIAIIRRFAENQKQRKWLVIADDDTLFNVERLLNVLKCHDATVPVIIGERYGYGFGFEGDTGYDYPTGGAGMVFSVPAAKVLADECECPNFDSPDDMIIGLCSRSLQIPIISLASFHQARPPDYADDYLKRILPVSFHKHWNIDPDLVYKEWLKDRINESQKTIDEILHHDQNEL